MVLANQKFVIRSLLTALLCYLLSACDQADVPPPIRSEPPALQPMMGLKINEAPEISRTFESVAELRTTLQEIVPPPLTLHEMGANDTVVAVVVAIPNSDFQPSIRGIAETTPLGISAGELMLLDEVDVIAGSGFISQFEPLAPLGLLKINNKLVGELDRHGYTRVLGVDNQQIKVIPKKDYTVELFESAMQVGPGIVEENQLDISTRELKLPPYLRSFVATCNQQTLVGITLVPINLYNLGNMILEYDASAKLGCKEVVNLSGDTQALLAIRSAGGWIYIGDPTATKTAFVTFTTKVEPPLPTPMLPAPMLPAEQSELPIQ